MPGLAFVFQRDEGFLFKLPIRQPPSADLLRFQTAHVGDQSLDFVIRQGIERFHQGLAILVLHPFFDRLGRRIILQLRLNLGVREILDAQFLAHFGLALAIRAEALGAERIPDCFSVRRGSGYYGGETECCCNQD